MKNTITLKDFIKITDYGYKIDISKYINKKISYQSNMKNIFNMIDDKIKGSFDILTSIKNITHLKKIFKYEYRLSKHCSYFGYINIYVEDGSAEGISVYFRDIFIHSLDLIKDDEILLFDYNNCNDYHGDFSLFFKQIENQQKSDIIETI